MLFSPLEEASGQFHAVNVSDVSSKNIDTKIYPNPVQDIFQLSNSEGVKSISINNIAGKEVRRFIVSSNHNYSIADLRKGVYIVRLFNYKDEPVKVVRLNKT
jgi:hypothetical protein